MKKLLILFILLVSCAPAFSLSSEEEFWSEVARINRGESYTERVGNQHAPVWKAEGVYVDGRGQVPEFQRIPPPNPEKIPAPRATHTIEPYDSYYYSQILGWRRPATHEPIIPGYNMHYSNRIAKPYTHRDYLDVWCTGKIDYNENKCSIEGYEVYFVHARNWAARATTLPFKLKQAHAKGSRVGLFLEVDSVGIDSEHVVAAKGFARMFNLTLFAATIDAFLPMDYFVE